MNRRVVLGIFVVLLLVVVGVAAGGYAYNIGVAQGLANSGKLVAPQGDGVVAPYYYGAPFFYHPFGFGFGFLGCLFPLLGFFLIFSLLRLVFWGGGWGGHRGWGRRGLGWPEGDGQNFGPGGPCVPPMFSQWHKRAHGEHAPQ